MMIPNKLKSDLCTSPLDGCSTLSNLSQPCRQISTTMPSYLFTTIIVLRNSVAADSKMISNIKTPPIQTFE